VLVTLVPFEPAKRDNQVAGGAPFRPRERDLRAVWDNSDPVTRDAKASLKERSLEARDRYEGRSSNREGTKEAGLYAAERVSNMGRVATTVKAEHVGDASAKGREHRDRRNECVVSLAMDDVPPLTGYHGWQSGSKIHIGALGHGANANHVDSCNPLVWREPTLSVGRKDSDSVAPSGEPACDLIRVNLCPSRVWKKTRRYIQQSAAAKRT
jgi:hypothetical protein